MKTTTPSDMAARLRMGAVAVVAERRVLIGPISRRDAAGVSKTRGERGGGRKLALCTAMYSGSERGRAQLSRECMFARKARAGDRWSVSVRDVAVMEEKN